MLDYLSADVGNKAQNCGLHVAYLKGVCEITNLLI